jgi:acyl-coenzyme A thioesterase PaaI-like protein
VGMTAFDEATAVRRTGDGCYETVPDERFAMISGPGGPPPAVNGGVLLAAVLRCVLDTSPHPHPVATSAHYLRVPKLAPAQVEVSWLKTGRTAATARAALRQDGELLLDTTVTTGIVPGVGTPVADGELAWTGKPPVLPPPSECVDLGRWRGDSPPVGYNAQVLQLMDPATAGWRERKPSGVPEMRGYFRLADEREPDAYLLALAVDSLPPVVFGLGAIGWAPTVELTWYMRAVPVPGQLRVAARCRHVGGGWFDEDAEVWDDAGQLVAQGRQIARVGRQRATERS